MKRPAPINRRLVVFAAVVTALLGALFGSTLRYLGQPDVGRLRFEGGFYRAYYSRTPLLGAALGAALGAGFAVISQTARRRSAAGRPARGRR